MRRAFAKITFLLMFVIVPASELRAQVTASLAAIPAETLPGIPVDFRLTLSSASSEPVTLRNGALLEVTTEAGATFFAIDAVGDVLGAPVHKGADVLKNLVVQPGTSRDYYWLVECSLTSELFFDPRMSKPGRYSIRMKLLTPLPPSTPVPIPNPDPATAEGVWTNAVTVTVRQPQGDDAAVWAMLLQRAAAIGRDGFSSAEWINANPFQIAQDIYAQYPRSSYVPYVACFKPGPLMEDRLRHLEAALALNPQGPIADRLKMNVAGIHNFLAGDASSALDAEGAIAETALARQILQQVQSQSVYPFIRDEAAYGLAHLVNDDGNRKIVADLTNDRRNSPYPQVIPFVDCVSVQKDGGLTARFGYRNIKDQTETIPEGATNSIYPADAVKNMPTTFRSGTRKNAIRATSSGVPITWRLLSFQVTATKTSPPCKGNN